MPFNFTTTALVLLAICSSLIIGVGVGALLCANTHRAHYARRSEDELRTSDEAHAAACGPWFLAVLHVNVKGHRRQLWRRSLRRAALEAGALADAGPALVVPLERGESVLLVREDALIEDVLGRVTTCS